MEPPQASLDLYERSVGRGASASILALRSWDRLTPTGDWDVQWPPLARRIGLIVSAYRVAAAEASAATVPATLAETSGAGGPIGTIQGRAFAGWAGSGVPMDAYLTGAMLATKQASGGPAERLAAGGSWLDGLVTTAVSDATRGGLSVGIAATPGAGFTRYEPEPYCQRCAPLVGKFFKWNEGFKRHPRCEAVHVPVSESAPEDERQLSAQLDPSKIKDLTDAQAQAIADGADPYQVINAYRDANPGQRTSMQTTAEGGTRKGLAGKVRSSLGVTGPRLTPEAIYRVSASREEAVRLLARNGYITGTTPDALAALA